MPRGMWDRSPSRDWTQAPCIGSTVLTTEPPGKAKISFLMATSVGWWCPSGVCLSGDRRKAVHYHLILTIGQWYFLEHIFLMNSIPTEVLPHTPRPEAATSCHLSTKVPTVSCVEAGPSLPWRGGLQDCVPWYPSSHSGQQWLLCRAGPWGPLHWALTAAAGSPPKCSLLCTWES